MNKLSRKLILFIVVTLCMVLVEGQQCKKNIEAKTVKISVKNKTILIGRSFKITVKNVKKSTKVKYTVSKKKIVKVKKIKKNKYIITGLKKGKVTITFKVRGKKYKCAVIVNKKKNTPIRPSVKPVKPTIIPEETTVHIHSYIKQIEKIEPKCGTSGYIIYQCKCGQTCKEIIKPYVEHKLTPWIISKMPTYSEVGIKYKECILCHTVVVTEQIPKLPEKPLENAGDKTDEKDDEIDVRDVF